MKKVVTGIALASLSFVTSTLRADAPKEQPVGLVLAAGGSKVLRAKTATPLAARAGDILFSGDSLKSEGAPVSFVFCPGKTSQTLDPATDVLLDTQQVKVRSGKIGATKPANTCYLPTVARVSAASEQHYGVSMTRGLAKPEGDIVAFDALPADVKAQLAPLEAALKADPNDAQALVEEATIFERAKLEPNALAAFRKASVLWPDAVWIRGRIFELEEHLATQAAIKAAAIAPDAKTYAMIVGIGKYQKLPQDLWLQFPGADAKAFGDFLSSKAGGAVPPDQMMVLSDEQATTAALRNAFHTFLKSRPGKKDTVFILLAGHGTVDTRGAYLVTYDSDPQDLSTTALSMAELQKLVEEELGQVGRVVLLADVCRATTIGNTKPASIAAVVEKLGEAPGEMLGLMASRPKEVSSEGAQYGGGHGAFTWSILQALEGQGDENKDRSVSAGELIDYVRSDVPGKSGNKQHPRDFGNMENATKLSDVSKAGINITRFKSLYDSRNGGPIFIASAADEIPLSDEAKKDIEAFQAAIRDKKILPGEQGSAYDMLAKLRAEMKPELAQMQENALRIALENMAQQVLLRYLAGDQNPQTKSDFDAGSKYMEAAIRLTPESLYLQGRDNFFAGRAMLFEKNFAGAADLLEKSVRIDPGEAYGYNALGIAYLEQAAFAKSIPAFQDAARLAPNWSYPLHNLALAYVESGDTEGAVRAYQQAMKVTPQYAYLPYNLGLIYQRTNRRREAEQAYRRAAELAPNSPEPLNALGSLKSQMGRAADAEKLYRAALAKNSNPVPTRHNLALLLGGLKGRESEAVTLWRQNLTERADFLPSRLALAELLAKTGDANAAVTEYRMVIASRPEYIGARVALAAQLLKANQPEASLEQLQAALKVETGNASLWEQAGDAHKALKQSDQSRTAYTEALKLEEDKAARKRIRAKMAS